MLDTHPTSVDAEWKKIQQNTFTRWCNEHLKCVNKYIYNLETDFVDGLKLIALLEVLSHKEITRYNKKPLSRDLCRPQKLENISIALKFIESENIRLVNVDANDIFKRNITLILGLIWTLILKYQISMPYLDDDYDERQKMTPQQALLEWVKSKMPESVPMDNLNKAWNDGRAVACLVDAVAPGLFPECEDLDPADRLENARQAMKTAEDWLGVPQVITSEEITNPNVDELSVMTYVSYFPEAKLKPGAPLRPRTHPSAKCSTKGPGVLEPKGLVVKKPASFSVFTQGAGVGKLNVSVWGPGKLEEEVIVQDNQDHTYECQYFPQKQGKCDVHVKWNGRHIPKNPFRVEVGRDLDASQAYATGPGLQPEGIQAGKYTDFTVFTEGAGEGQVSVKVIDSCDGEDVDNIIEPQEDEQYFVEYQPVNAGKHTIKVLLGGQPICKSPFHVMVSPPRIEPIPSKVRVFGAGKPREFTVETKGAGIDSLGFAIEGPSQTEIHCQERSPGFCDVRYYPTTPGNYAIHVTCGDEDIPKSPFTSPAGDAKKVYAEGPGLQPEGVVAGVPAEFTVFAKGAGEGDVDVRVIDNKGKKVPADITNNKDGTYSVVYYPTTVGAYTVNITFNSEIIPKSPFRVNVCQTNFTACRAYGPGLEKGFVNQNNEFKIETKGAGEGGLGLTIEGPSEAQIECKDKGDGSCDVTYLPPDPGDYAINILFADEHIPGSPFKAKISYPFDASKLKVEGPGIGPGIRAGEPADINIDTRMAGDAELKVEAVYELNSPVHCDIDEEEYGIYTVTYYPKKKGNHKVSVKYGGVHAPGSPFNVAISPKSDVSKVQVTGPGVEPTGVQPVKPTYFTIHASEAGKGDVHVKVEPVKRGRPVDVKKTEEGKDTFKCEYVAPVKGAYKIDVKFDGIPVPGSPFPVEVAKPGDAGKCKAQGDGLETAIIDQLAEFDVYCKSAGEGQLMAVVDNPSGAHTDTLVTDNEDGTYSVSYTPFEEGIHTLSVKFGGDHIPGSPFKVDVLPPTDATKCKAYGPGLENALVGKPADFTVETKGAGAGGLSLAIEGPSEAKLTCNDHGDGTCSVKYTPTEPGDYEIHVKFADEHIPGSPFSAKVTRPVDASKVKCYGPGVDRINPLYSKTPQEFTVDTSEAGDADLEVTVETPNRKTLKPQPFCERGDGVYTVDYTPEDEGRYTVNVKYGDKHVPNSPFRVRAGPPFDASKVKVSGPGVDESPLTDVPLQFIADCTEAGTASLTASIAPPSGVDLPVDVKENGDRTYTIEYVPEKPGCHIVDIKYGGEGVPRSPFRVHVKPSCDASKVGVDGLGPDDTFTVGKESDVTVDTTKAGKGDYDISCKFADKDIPGSPFTAHIYSNYVDLDTAAPRTDDIAKGVVTAKLERPNGGKERLELLRINDDGTLAVTFIPYEPGEHLIYVYKRGREVQNSPFSVIVHAQRVGDVYPVGHTYHLDFRVPEDREHLVATLKHPSRKVDESLKFQPGPQPGTISVSFVPRKMSVAKEKDLHFIENFGLSGAAAIISKTAAAPIERVKLLVQNQDEMMKAGRLDTPYKGVIDCTKRTYQAEGIISFWRGNLANCIRYFPTQALNFAFKDQIKALFKPKRSDSYATKFSKNIASGGAAGAMSLLFVYSLDYARTRLANDAKSAGKGSERQFNGLVDVYRKTLASDGIVGLYRGFVISCVGIVVYRGFYFGLYDTLKPILLGDDAPLVLSFMLGYGVTVTSGLASYPIDTIRRRMMMTSGQAVKYKGSIDCTIQIMKNEGFMSLMKGAGANILRGMAGAGVLAGFDKFKKLYVACRFDD